VSSAVANQAEQLVVVIVTTIGANIADVPATSIIDAIVIVGISFINIVVVTRIATPSLVS
jgi:hypothetical protein